MKRKRSKSKRRLKRDLKTGHFLKRTKRRRTVAKAARANPRKRTKTRTRAKRTIARSNPRKARSRVKKRATPKKRICRKRTVRAHVRKSGTAVAAYKSRSKKCRHKVAAHHRKNKSGGTTLVRAHLSREEETPMARRRRRARKSREVIANPRRRRRRRSARESAAMVPYGHKFKKRKSRSRTKKRSAARTRRRRLPKLYGSRVSVRKRVGGRTRSVTVRVSGRRHRGSKQVRVKRRYRGRTRTIKVYAMENPRRTRRKPVRRRRARRYHSRELMLNPIGYSGVSEYALENPMSGGELALAAGTATLGFMLSEAVDRYLATTALATTPAGQGAEAGVNLRMISGPPSMTRLAAGVGMAGVPFLGAYWVKSPMGRAALQGAGLGAAVRLLGQVIKSFVIAKIFPPNAQGMSTNATVNRLFPDTLNSAATSASDIALQATAGKAGGQLAGVPQYSALPYGYPQAQTGVGQTSYAYAQPAPVAVQTGGLIPGSQQQSIASMMAAVAPVNPATPDNVPVPPTTPPAAVASPVLASSGGSYPCSNETVGQSVQRAYDSATRNAGVNGIPQGVQGLSMAALFPMGDD